MFALCAVGVSALPKTSTTVHSNISMSEVTATPSQAPDSSLTMLAFGRFYTDTLMMHVISAAKYLPSAGVMSFILILIVVMVILVTTINLRGRCRDTRQNKGGFFSHSVSFKITFQSKNGYKFKISFVFGFCL